MFVKHDDFCQKSAGRRTSVASCKGHAGDVQPETLGVRCAPGTNQQGVEAARLPPVRDQLHAPRRPLRLPLRLSCRADLLQRTVEMQRDTARFQGLAHELCRVRITARQQP
jgi:hypothetical protein